MPLRSKNLVVQVHNRFTMDAMEGKDWQPVMNKGISIMNDYGFVVQPGSGTLLGLVREPDFYIHHDTDIDIDVIITDNDEVKPERILKLVDAFKAQGFSLIRTQHYLGLPMQVAFIHRENNLIFDLCFFYRNWGTDWMNVYEHGVFVRPPYSVEEVEFKEFNGSEYIVPIELDRYLTGRYGNWRVPTSGKESGEKDAASYLVVL